MEVKDIVPWSKLPSIKYNYNFGQNSHQLDITITLDKIPIKFGEDFACEKG